MTKREINERIYLSGIKPQGYRVIHSMPIENFEFFVPNIKIGNAIVRALRELAYQERSK